jgi:hypothetical protein
MLADNNWYGHRDILLRYCRVKSKPVFAFIQHGWYGQECPTFKERVIKCAPILTWGNKIANYLKKKKIKNIQVVGSPFLYLDRLIKKDRIKKKGSIFFPDHSTFDTKQNVNILYLANYIKKNYPQPLTASLYFNDYVKKNILILKKRGFRVVCFGNRAQKEFLYNVHNEISKHKYLITSSFNTPLFYGMYLKNKCRVLLFNKKKYLQRYISPNIKIFLEKLNRDYKKILEGTLSLKKQLKLAKKELGFAHIKSRAKLKQLLGVDNEIKIFFAKIIFYTLNISRNYKDLREGKK